jgi:AcrR family transcriptional regulator
MNLAVNATYMRYQEAGATGPAQAEPAVAGSHQRARSVEDKQRRAEDLLDAARVLAAELGGVRHVTLAAVTERAGLHPSGVRREDHRRLG